MIAFDWRMKLLLGLGMVMLAAVLLAAWVTGMPGSSYRGPLPPLTPAEQELAGRLKQHVHKIAGEIGEHNLFHEPALEAAAVYVESVWAGLGYQVQRLGYEVGGRPVRNLQVEIPGGAQRDEIVLVGAHYDSVPGAPGANDNGSGVAALLELGRLLREHHPARTVRLVAFVNEEPPYFQTANMGSAVYARQAKARGDHISAMISLETIGYYADAPGSQRYPFPFSLFYPDTGNFIGFVANVASGALVRQAIQAFRREARFPSEGVAAPMFIPGIAWSDQWAFWEQGYPAIMVTDTAPFRYPYYHTAQDTPDKVDYERTARVTAGVARVVADLAG